MTPEEIKDFALKHAGKLAKRPSELIEKVIEKAMSGILQQCCEMTLEMQRLTDRIATIEAEGVPPHVQAAWDAVRAYRARFYVGGRGLVGPVDREIEALDRALDKVVEAWPEGLRLAIRSERDRLRAAQTLAVMPRIGPLLDAWEAMMNDEKAMLAATNPAMVRAIESISRAMLTAGDAEDGNH